MGYCCENWEELFAKYDHLPSEKINFLNAYVYVQISIAIWLDNNTMWCACLWVANYNVVDSIVISYLVIYARYEHMHVVWVATYMDFMLYMLCEKPVHAMWKTWFNNSVYVAN